MSINNKVTGFTLLEVLLAMTLLSIMVTLLFASLRIGAESWDKGETKIAEVNEKAIVYQFFKRHLPSIRPLQDDFSESSPQFSFQGQKDQLQFVSIFPASAERKGLQIFEVGMDKSEQGVIKVKLKPFYPTEEEQQWKDEEVVLLKNVEQFELAYLGRNDTEEKGVWTNNWLEKNQLPQLIKIKIELQDKSYWPEMIFALKITKGNKDNEGFSADNEGF